MSVGEIAFVCGMVFGMVFGFLLGSVIVGEEAADEEGK